MMMPTVSGEERKEQELIKAQKEAEEVRFPLKVVYCRVCGIPPEYCMFDKKDSSECKTWLQNTHPVLFD